MEIVTEEKACECFKTGIDCSQVVFEHCAGKLGFDTKQALKIASAFGGGMWQGETCGCVAGALMSLGLKYGTDAAGQTETKQNLLAKKAEFETRFKEKNGSLICREILGYDLSTKEGMAAIMEKGLLFSVCPKAAVSACDILDEMI